MINSSNTQDAYISSTVGDEENNLDDFFHYQRECSACGNIWFSLHCPHDGIQTPCNNCGNYPIIKKSESACVCEFVVPLPDAKIIVKAAIAAKEKELYAQFIIMNDSTVTAAIAEVLDEIEAYVAAREAAARIEGLNMCREKPWNATEGAQSEEEVGFQKGITAQIRLTNRRIDEMVAQLTKGGAYE